MSVAAGARAASFCGLRIPIRGYEDAGAAIGAKLDMVTNPYKGL